MPMRRPLSLMTVGRTTYRAFERGKAASHWSWLPRMTIRSGWGWAASHSSNLAVALRRFASDASIWKSPG